VNICQNLSQHVIAPSLTSCNERGRTSARGYMHVRVYVRVCVRARACMCVYVRACVEPGKTCVKLRHAMRKSWRPKSLSHPTGKFFDKNNNLFGPALFQGSGRGRERERERVTKLVPAGRKMTSE